MIVGKKVKERFWAKVNKGGPRGCWLWTAARSGSYGHLGVDSKDKLAHRFSWEMVHGPIPKGLWCLHKCDVPTCVNPEHLFLGTPRDNTRDAVAKGRIASGNRQGAHTHPECIPRGESHGCAKLTEGQVREIRQRYERGEFQAALAIYYGVAGGTLCEIVHRKLWRHIA